mmetsp:Transcript_6497/g.21017  ORF Transcript_6497/g.21017 Transcript_6497/m.21017 type:complete len:88 (+) Transcript_6497:298-561(+)
MYSTGMTPEKERAFADLEKHLANTKDLLHREQAKTKDLESKVFELQLAVGGDASPLPTARTSMSGSPRGTLDDDDDALDDDFDDVVN